MASEVIIAHNHPSGNLNPSKQDQYVTNQIKSALQLINVKLLDHLIISENGYLSFLEDGYL